MRDREREERGLRMLWNSRGSQNVVILGHGHGRVKGQDKRHQLADGRNPKNDLAQAVIIRAYAALRGPGTKKVSDDDK